MWGHPILGGRSRFWEGRRCLKRGYILGRRVNSECRMYICLKGVVDYESVAYSGSEGSILEGWVDYHYGRVAYLRRGGIFWEGGVDSGRAGWILVASHRPIVVEKGGIFWKEWVDYGNSHIVTKKGVYILGGRGGFWEGRISV